VEKLAEPALGRNLAVATRKSKQLGIGKNIRVIAARFRGNKTPASSATFVSS
jgi:hypothetical protein